MVQYLLTVERQVALKAMWCAQILFIEIGVIRVMNIVITYHLML